MMNKLAPPKNYRPIIPKCCGTCKHIKNLGRMTGRLECARDPQIYFIIEPYEYNDCVDMFYVCDEWETCDPIEQRSMHDG
jgi:hypothetical protein